MKTDSEFICFPERKEGISAIFKENNNGHFTQQIIDKYLSLALLTSRLQG
jgi:hypothetical protein